MEMLSHFLFALLAAAAAAAPPQNDHQAKNAFVYYLIGCNGFVRARCIAMRCGTGKLGHNVSAH